jgi:SAM-dependent methyltransferase
MATPPRSPALAERDREEIRRSAEEARNFLLVPFTRSQIERYLDPPANTPYGLEYAFHLVGDVRGKRVLDLGCGKGENLVVLAERGGSVIGIDISADLVRLAETRIHASAVKANLAVASAYQTGLPDESVDIIFCAALIHHLDIPRVREEMLRILKRGGFVVLLEPIRFSRLYDWFRKLLPSRENVSEYEHPLTRSEFDYMVSGFSAENLRYFRLPFVPLTQWLLRGKMNRFVYSLSAWLIAKVPALQRFATSAAVRLRKSV